MLLVVTESTWEMVASLHYALHVGNRESTDCAHLQLYNWSLLASDWIVYAFVWLCCSATASNSQQGVQW